MGRSPMSEQALPRRATAAVYTTNVVTCLGLWIPLLAAIWFCRGWIGLFFSGQVLSAGACLLQILAKRTCYAFSASSVPAHEFESRRNES
jgi:hypothetical protein